MDLKILVLLNIHRNLSQINSYRQHFGSSTQSYQNNLFHTRYMIFSSNNEPRNNQKDTGVLVHPRRKSSHPSFDCLSLSQFHQHQLYTTALIFTARIKRRLCGFLFSLSHIKSGQCVVCFSLERATCSL